jgi:CRISPR-associated endonuclease/helicase Cas3
MGRAVIEGGMKALFPEYSRPHQVQTLVDVLPTSQSLAVIEAPTGSGKTETALAYAARLLAAGEAESIIFALPTQATADAMLERIVKIAKRLFDDADVVLAHGKSRFNATFIDLKRVISRERKADAPEREASAQCARWLSESRKRVFLGQIGVCTVDQVLVSALPVRHRFVRGFGLGKSVLIIDEVHAYDAYMYGLLDKVLRHQKAMGGSAIVLSATLPLALRHCLVESWGGQVEKLKADNPYPLITRTGSESTELYPLPERERQRLVEEQKQSPRDVRVVCRETSDMLPDGVLEQQILEAADSGVNIVVICNLVADAQMLASRLSDQTDRPVLLFHSRYRFKDRQVIQDKVMALWGKGGERPDGAILVATQVVEQSLDIDFDWMVTQLCPVDLLFQRLGRLHRHTRSRPQGFEEPKCTVLLPVEQRYELHKLIYGNGDAPNSRVLWRTEQMVRRYPRMRFPDVYRPVIESVYTEDAWPDEPGWIVEEYEKYWQAQYASRLNANRISNMENAWNDDDSHVSLLTRDGEMSLNIVPFERTDTGQCFLGETTPVDKLEEWQRAEQTMRNTIPAPASWRRFGLPDPAVDGLIWLPMQLIGSGLWQFITAKGQLIYTQTNGLRIEKDESAD